MVRASGLVVPDEWLYTIPDDPWTRSQEYRTWQRDRERASQSADGKRLKRDRSDLADGRCEICGRRGCRMELHHRPPYKPIGAESIRDVLLVCGPVGEVGCHMAITAFLRRRRGLGANQVALFPALADESQTVALPNGNEPTRRR
jgi:hypothetical protein